MLQLFNLTVALLKKCIRSIEKTWNQEEGEGWKKEERPVRQVDEERRVLSTLHGVKMSEDAER